MIDNSWLTQEYLYSIGYYKVKDDGQYGIYNSLHLIAVSRTYGPIPKDYRTIKFNRDIKYGVFLGIKSDWDTRHSITNSLVINKQEFETLLTCSI